MSYSYKDLLCRGNITIEVVDDIALYKAELLSSNGNIFRQTDKSTDITFIVFKGAEDITNKFSDIEWKRFTFKSNGEEDKGWGDKYKGKTQITLTKEEVEGKCVIQCSAYENKNNERTLMAATSITFIDVNDFTPSQTPPENPIDGDIWIDNSTDPPTIKVWDDEKGKWVVIGNTGSSTKNLINNSNFWKSYNFDDFTLIGDLTDYRIAPYETKKWAQLKANNYDELERGIYQDINKSIFVGEVYLIQAKAYTLDNTGLYNGGITLNISDIIESDDEESKIISVNTIAAKNFKLTQQVQTIYFTFTMPTKFNKLRLSIYGEKGTAFHIAFTDICLSHNTKLHDWEISQDDLEYKINNKVDNDPESIFNGLTDNGKLEGIYTAIDEETGKENYYINATHIKSGTLDAEFIDAKGLVVSKEDGTKTLEVTRDGDVHLKVNKFSLMPAAETNVASKDDLSGKVDRDKEDIITSLDDPGIFLEGENLRINATTVTTGILKSKNDVSIFDLDKGTFRLGENDSNFKMKFDGSDLLFGKGSIRWENLDDQIVDELAPYDVYLEKTSVIVSEDINETSVYELNIPDNKPVNRIGAAKGNSKLTPVEIEPIEGQVSFRIVEQNNCTAIKHAPDSFYVDKVNAEYAYVKVEINCESKSTYLRTMTITKTNIEGTEGPPGQPGAAGPMASFIYKKSLDKPEKPTGNDPDGWFTRIEDIIETGHLWCSQGIKTTDTHELVGEWSDPFKLEEMEHNLLINYKWTPGSGKESIYEIFGTENENIRELGFGPKQNTEVLWKAVNADDSSPSNFWDGGFSASVAIDKNKTYRFSVWVKQEQSTNLIKFTPDLTNSTDMYGEQTNVTFFDGRLPKTDKWYLLVGYVVGVGSPYSPANSGIYDFETGERLVLENGREFDTFKNKDTANKQSIRIYMYSAEEIGAKTIFSSPRIDIVDGNEPSIDSLIGKFSDLKWIYEWNGTKTEINGSSVLTPKIFAGTIDETTKKHTGIAIGEKIVDEDSGIIGYNSGEKTFHIKTDGSAVFGKNEKDQIIIGTDGTLTLPKIKGENIEAKNLVVKHQKENGEWVDTLVIEADGSITLRPTTFEMLSDEEGEGGDDGDLIALSSNLGKLGMKFDNSSPPQFYINATQITTGQLTADRLNLKGLKVTYNDDNGIEQPSLEITSEGRLKMYPSEFELKVSNGYGGSYDLSTPDGIVNMINNSDPSIKISANHIRIEGLAEFVTKDDLYYDQGSTFIHGGNIRTGTITTNMLYPGTNNRIVLEEGKSPGDVNSMSIDINGGNIRVKKDKNVYIMVGDGGFRYYNNGNRFDVNTSYDEIYLYNLSLIPKNDNGVVLTCGTNTSNQYFNDIYSRKFWSVTPTVGSFVPRQRSNTRSNTNILQEEQKDMSYDFFKNFSNNTKEIYKSKIDKKSKASLLSNNLNQFTDMYQLAEDDNDIVFEDVNMISGVQSLALEKIINKLEFIEQENIKLKSTLSNITKALNIIE